MRVSPRFLGFSLVASTTATCLAYHWLFGLLHRFDWGQPLVKLACFEAFSVLILLQFYWRKNRTATPTERVMAVEMTAAIAILVWECVRMVALLRTGLHTGMNDLGYTDENAVRALALDHANPYELVIAKNGDDPSYWGFKYAPGMLLGYPASIWWPDGVGLKITNMVFLLVTAGLVGWLVALTDSSPGRRPWLRWSPAMLAAALTLLPERLYHELFNQGAVDIFPTMLMIGALICVRRQAWLGVGLLLGLSFSAKLSPVAFMLVLFFRPQTPRRFLVGLALGLLPFVPFLIWDAPALLRNVFIFHSMKDYDTTSLYSITPKELQYLFTVFQLAAVAVAVAVSFKRPFAIRELVVVSTLLLIAIEISYREIHGNHMIGFVPLFALIFTWYRHWLVRLRGPSEQSLPSIRRSLP
jgi:hypothetical protein